MTVTGWDPLRGTDWDPLLRQKLGKEYWTGLQAFLEDCSGDEHVHPPSELVFEALRRTERADTKVVIVGQDPYPGVGQANGLAFAVPRHVRIPPSLANIHRELHDDMCLVIPNHGSLESWARRGVLLLNATLTIRNGATSLHRRTWKAFTDAVIRVVDEIDPVYILWGRVAQRKTLALIDEAERAVIKSSHPSPLSARLSFCGSKPFNQANKALVDTGREAIDWSLTD